jgi:hypothetical protein
MSARQGVVVASKHSQGRITVWRTVLVVMAAAVALLAAAAAMAASHGDSSEADRLRATETTRLQALVDADTATARALMAPDFQVINPAGGVSGREEYMDAIQAGVIDYLVFEPASPIAVRLSGDSAALRYQVSFDLVVGGDTRVTHQGWITELLRAPPRTLADRLGAGNRDPEQLRPVRRVDQTGRLKVIHSNLSQRQTKVVGVARLLVQELAACQGERLCGQPSIDPPR